MTDATLAAALEASGAAFAAQRFADAERVATAAISRWPFDARPLAHAAISAFKQGAFARAAEHAANAAALEPWLSRHWRLLAAASASLGRDGDARCIFERIHALFPGDRAAADALAALKHERAGKKITAAVAAMRARPTLSACLIVRNEAARLPRCLESLRGAVDEIVVVDTGSTDATREIAEQHGARVGYFEWCDDFSAARNQALELARGDWVLIIDADETLAPGGADALAAAIRDQSAGAAVLGIDEQLDGGGAYREKMVRAFRRHPAVRFEGRIHEQITPSLKRAGFAAVACDAVLAHDGYMAEVVAAKGKIERNERLLRAEISRAPADPYWRYQLGKNEMMAARPEAALRSFAEARALLDVSAETPPYAGELVACELRLLVAARRFEEVLALVDHAKTPDAVFFVGQAFLELGRADEALGCFQRVIATAAECSDNRLPIVAAEVVTALDATPPTALTSGGVSVLQAKHGAFMVNTADTFAARSLLRYREWCEHELSPLLPLLTDGMVVVEAGAGVGAHTVPIAKAVGERGRVVAFESNPRAQLMLCGNLALNELANVTPLRADRACIDELLLERCHLLKISSGDAAAVLRAAKDTVARARPVIFASCEGAPSREILEVIEAFGYRAYWHVASMFNPENHACNPSNVFAGCQPRVSVLAVAADIQVDGLVPVAGPEEDWRQAYARKAGAP